MRNAFYKSLAALAVSLSATPVNALVIDDFSAFSVGATATDGTPIAYRTNLLADSSILGMQRDVRVERMIPLAGATPSTVSFSNIPDFAQLTPGNHSPAIYTFQWDGAADVGYNSTSANTIDLTTGLGAVNLGFGGSNGIIVPISNGAAISSATFSIWGSDNIEHSHTLPVSANFNGDLEFIFDDFTPGLTPSYLSTIKALQLELTLPTGITTYINGVIQTADIYLLVPEPSMMTMLLPMLGGMIWRRRRRAAMAKVS